MDKKSVKIVSEGSNKQMVDVLENLVAAFFVGQASVPARYYLLMVTGGCLNGIFGNILSMY